MEVAEESAIQLLNNCRFEKSTKIILLRVVNVTLRCELVANELIKLIVVVVEGRSSLRSLIGQCTFEEEII